MKKLITLLLLIFMALPVFAEQEYHQNLDGTYSPCVSDLPIHRFYSKLYREYRERARRGECEFSGRDFNHYVKLPTTRFMQAFDKKFNGKNYRPDYTEEDFQKFADEFYKNYDFEKKYYKD